MVVDCVSESIVYVAALTRLHVGSKSRALWVEAFYMSERSPTITRLVTV